MHEESFLTKLVRKNLIGKKYFVIDMFSLIGDLEIIYLGILSACIKRLTQASPNSSHASNAVISCTLMLELSRLINP